MAGCRCWRSGARTAKILFDVNRSAFVPPPTVTSPSCGWSRCAEPLAPARLADLEKVTAAAFGQRRKMLRQSLKPLGGEALIWNSRHRSDAPRRDAVGRRIRGAGPPIARPLMAYWRMAVSFWVLPRSLSTNVSAIVLPSLVVMVLVETTFPSRISVSTIVSAPERATDTVVIPGSPL